MRRDHQREFSKEQNSHRRGITRVELLLVFALGVLLTGCGKAIVDRVQESSNQEKALRQAKGISQALKVYSLDEDGAYPAGESSNEAFAEMFPELGTEEPFFVRGSAWHGRGRFEDGPDGLWDEDEEGTVDAGLALEPGENHWAFNVDADTESPAHIPLIADGFSAQVGRYNFERDEVGGVWRGKSAIVVTNDGSGEIVELDKHGRYLDPRSNRDHFLREGVEMINPMFPAD